jgi:hypothetical protein
MPLDHEVLELVSLTHTSQTLPERQCPDLLRFVYIKSRGVRGIRIPKYWYGMIRDQLVSRQDKFRIKAVRRRFVDRLPGKISLQTIFIVAVGTGRVGLTIRGQFLLLVHHHEFGAAPWLTRLPDVSPEEIVFPVKSSSNKIVPGRLIGDRLVEKGVRLVEFILGCLATSKQQGRKC